MFKHLLSALFLCIISSSSYANIEVQFRDGAPKDKFTISNKSICDVQKIAMNIDLTNSNGRLIFDTTASGQGVEVFQPFEVTKGQVSLNKTGNVNDGDKLLSLIITSIAANDTASFTIDVDDTLAKSELGNIRVTDAEIAKGTVSATINNNEALNATFDGKGKAVLLMANCAN